MRADLDQDAEERAAIEHAHRRAPPARSRPRRGPSRAASRAARARRSRGTAPSPMRTISPSGSSAAKSSRATVAPSTATASPRSEIALGQEAAAADLRGARSSSELAGRADDHDLAAALADARPSSVADRRSAPRCATVGHARASASRVVERQVVRARRRSPGIAAGGLGLAGHDDRRRFEPSCANCPIDVAPRALAERREQDHRRDPDRHAEQRQRRCAGGARRAPRAAKRERGRAALTRRLAEPGARQLRRRSDAARRCGRRPGSGCGRRAARRPGRG